MSKITKLGYGIVAFEGTEHIKNITYEIRPVVDEIVVCLQKLSYHNEPIDPKDVEEIEHLKEVGLVDKIIWFEPDLSYIEKGDDFEEKPRKIETDKRNFILKTLEDDGCSHSMITDSDEFYDRKEFVNAKKYIDEHDDVAITYCQYINYWKDYRHYMLWPFPCFVPFITESKYRFEFRCGCFNNPIDPTRIYKLEEGGRYDTFKWETIHMHHLSWIRLDIRKKIYSWSSKNYFKDGMADYVFDKFKKWKESECAIIMFNVPKNKVLIERMENQYIHPHYMLDERV